MEYGCMEGYILLLIACLAANRDRKYLLMLAFKEGGLCNLDYSVVSTFGALMYRTFSHSPLVPPKSLKTYEQDPMQRVSVCASTKHVAL
jgi:hypothetical protein